MENTHTTVIIEKDNWIEIVTLHDQSGSAAIGIVPLENIPMMIEGLKKFISVKPPVSRPLPCSDGHLIDEGSNCCKVCGERYIHGNVG